MTLEVDREHRVIDWVGGLPDRWEVHSLGSQLAENRSSNKGMIESRVLSLSYGNVIVKPEEKLRGLVPESFETYQIVEPGDIVIRPTDLQNDQTSLRVGQSKFRGIITSAYICLRPTAAMNHRYAAFLLSGYDHMKVFYGFGSGLRQNLDVKHIKHIPVPVPSLDEQELIVRYLDHAELRITKAIAAKCRVERLLSERQQLLAQDVLLAQETTGPKAPSGELWLGDVPSHWELRRMKGWFFERSVKGNPELPLLAATQRYGVITKERFGQRTVIAQNGLENLKLVEPGDFVISLRSFEGGIEVAHDRGIISPAYTVLRPFDPLSTPYFSLLFKTPAFLDALKMSVTGIREGQNINYQRLSRSLVPLPPLSERLEMEQKLRPVLESGLAALDEIRKEIELLREYRTRLISDVVTGKLDVREEAAKLPVIDPEELAEVTAGAGLTAEDDGDDE